jgi:3D-(3,5/4)-trihydroxycyclohexane-1,2-dione acylhydrolase (decyclizing)
VKGIGELEDALKRARSAQSSTVIVIDTDPLASTDAGGHWWDVAVPEVSTRTEVNTARKDYENAIASQRVGD